MRNWNEILVFILLPVDGSFYSTYEELKLYIVRLQIVPGKSFYSTYEELKLRIINIFKLVNISFYSTYEELKHSQKYF